MALQLVQHVLDHRGRLGLRHGGADDTDRLRLAAPGELLGDVAVPGHQGQDLVAALQRSRVAGHGRVVARRLADPREQRRPPGVQERVAGQGLVEVVLGGRAEAVATAAQVDEARVAGEDLALGLLARPVLLEHRLLEPEREAHLLQLAEQLVGGGRAQHDRHHPRQRQALHEHGIVVPSRGQVPEEVDTHELLRDRRAALGQPQPEPGAVRPLRERTRRRLLDHARQRAVVDPRVREEVLVLGREDGLAHDERHFVVRHHPPVLAGELDHDLSPGVRDLARRGRLEPDERSELGKVPAVEVDVLDERQPAATAAASRRSGMRCAPPAATRRRAGEAKVPPRTRRRRSAAATAARVNHRATAGIWSRSRTGYTV